MSTILDQTSFTALVFVFLTYGALKTFTAYYKSVKLIDKSKGSKVPSQVEIWINSYLSMNSAVAFIGFLTETYNYGARLIINLVAISIGYIVSVLILQPFFYDMNVKSPYEYLQKRYANRISIRVVCAFGAIIFHVSFSTLFLWSNAVILSTIFPDLKLWVSIIVIGLVSSLFALAGGFLQSIYANLLQFFLFFFGVLAALIVSITSFGENLSSYWDRAQLNGRLNYINDSNDLRTRYTIWNQLFSLPIPWCAFHGLLTPNVNRYKQVKSKATSSLFIISHLPVMFIVNGIAVFSGLLAHLYFNECDPFLSFKIENKNQIAPYWLIRVLENKLPTVSGLCLASILVYAIMQHSFGLSLCIQIFINDILNPILTNRRGKALSDTKTNIIKPILILIVAALSILYSIAFSKVRNSILSLFFLFNNSINSPIFGLFILSMFNPYANHIGAISSFVIVLGINFWLGISSLLTVPKNQEFTQNTNGCNSSNPIRNISINAIPIDNEVLRYMYQISSIWYCLFSLLFMCIIGSIISLLVACIIKKRADFDHDYRETRRGYLFSFKSHLILSMLCKKRKTFRLKKRNTTLDSEDLFMKTRL